MQSCVKIVRTAFESLNQSVYDWINGMGCNGNQMGRIRVKNVFDIKWIDSKKLEVNTLIEMHEANPMLKYLFTHNDIHYYGNQDIVHKSMIGLGSRMLDCYDLIGNAPVPHYVIIMYINAMYYNTFDINEIKSNDFINFLNLIDKNPTTALSIDLMDSQIMRYIDKNMLSKSEIDILKRLSVIHGLKYTLSYIDLLP